MRERKLEFLRMVTRSNSDLKSEGHHLIKTLTMPWSAPAISPNEEGEGVINSELIGKAIMLDPKECSFFTGVVRKIKRKFQKKEKPDVS